MRGLGGEPAAEIARFRRANLGELTGALKGAAKGRFWDNLAYSRIASWGRDFVSLQRYLLKNLAEALGLRPGRKGIDELALPRTGPPIEEIWGELLTKP